VDSGFAVAFAPLVRPSHHPAGLRNWCENDAAFAPLSHHLRNAAHGSARAFYVLRAMGSIIFRPAMTPIVSGGGLLRPAPRTFARPARLVSQCHPPATGATRAKRARCTFPSAAFAIIPLHSEPNEVIHGRARR
jgi:hypothetical protein